MGDAAEDRNDVDTEDELEQGIEPKPEDEEAEESAEDDEGSEDEGEDAELGDDEAEEVEIVLEDGDAPRFTQADVNDIVAKRVARLNKRGDASSKELDHIQEENRLLKLALEQKRKDGPPKPDDFAEGEYDPAYLQARKDYDSAQRDAEVARQVDERLQQERNARQQQEQSAQLEGRQREHYKRAAELKVKDYEATEDVAIEALGQDYVNQLIANFDDSHTLLYFLGKNPGEASRLASLIKTNPIRGVAEIGRLQAQIRVKPKSSRAPAPEAELEGSERATARRGPKGATYE